MNAAAKPTNSEIREPSTTSDSTETAVDLRPEGVLQRRPCQPRTVDDRGVEPALVGEDRGDRHQDEEHEDRQANHPRLVGSELRPEARERLLAPGPLELFGCELPDRFDRRGLLGRDRGFGLHLMPSGRGGPGSRR